MRAFRYLWSGGWLLACWMLGSAAFSQAPAGFSLLGSARLGSSATCLELTRAGNSSVGAVWLDKRLRLTQSFTLTFVLNFGTDPDGADGIVLVFHTGDHRTIGSSGDGIGYRSISPSLGVEFDTNQNADTGDPPADHVALLRNGLPDHRLHPGYPAPVPISTSSSSVKNGRDYLVKVHWNAPTQTIQVEVDCQVRITQTVDLVNTLFAGTSEVTWGFTSATGAATNTQTVCLPDLAPTLDTLPVCYHELVTLEAPLWANGQYDWRPATGLDAPQTRTPHLTADASRLYVVRHTDLCGQSRFDSTFVKLKSPALSLGSDKQGCAGDTVLLTPALAPAAMPVTYRWAGGATTAQLPVVASGTYSLTVSGNGCTTSASVAVTINPRPQPGSPYSLTYDCPNGQPLALDPQATGTALGYSWWPGGSTDPRLVATRPGAYAVTITSAVGCSAVQHFVVLANCAAELLLVPDAFTPNGDGTNDVLVWHSRVVTNPRLRIFNAWGELIFDSQTATPYWDGTYRGQPCPVGPYAWQIDYHSPTSPEPLTRFGRVLLLN